MSPPYWLTRDYEVDGQMGLEPTPREFVEKLCGVLDELWRVLRPDGTLWVVLGDRYIKSGEGGRAKSLALIPSRFAIDMTDRGWILRNVIVWHKPNAIPTSIKDRFTTDYEFVFFFAKNGKYYFNQQLEKSLFPGGRHVPKRPGSKGELVKRTDEPDVFQQEHRHGRIPEHALRLDDPDRPLQGITFRCLPRGVDHDTCQCRLPRRRNRARPVLRDGNHGHRVRANGAFVSGN